ncbi:hypothetical protein BDZ94DRAFT_596079 [Collybia nuda]|uniref:Uncharacterized protein n=1 Tax=Collybia nuda TaxID=64659 RepID=A0A9P6CF47_9AGAR|nr:hypothetical protein BDZ94DRAFT_596079 [Collybia nuda]
MGVEKRKPEPESSNSDDIQNKKQRQDEATTSTTPQTNNTTSLQKLLDFTSLGQLSDISDRFEQVGHALLHDFFLVVRCGSMETQFEILELEFYLLKSGCHEDPFTHGSEEQKFGGRWYFHRAPRRSADSHRSSTSLTGYRGGTRKGLDLTIGGPTTSASPYFPAAGGSTADEPLLRGGALLRSLRRVSDSKVISGPSLLVDQVLLLSDSTSISDLVQEKWGGDTAAFAPTTPTNTTASLYLKPRPANSNSLRPPVYRSPRIGLELSHPGTTASPTHPRVVFLPKPYRYFTHPELLTANGRSQTFLGVLQTLRSRGQYGDTIVHTGLQRKLIEVTGIREATVKKYLEDYKSGVDRGKLKSFVGPPGKGASSSPSSYLTMMGTLEKLFLDTKPADHPPE